jgi:hypothetical protein
MHAIPSRRDRDRHQSRSRAPLAQREDLATKVDERRHLSVRGLVVNHDLGRDLLSPAAADDDNEARNRSG